LGQERWGKNVGARTLGQERWGKNVGVIVG
jgi:hypothetical protein